MRMTTRLIGLGLAALLLAACGKKESPAQAPATKEAAASVAAGKAAASAPLRATPDFGGASEVAREADGIGSTPELAVLAALQSAVAQVNGVRVASQMQSLRAGLSVAENGQQRGDIRAEAFSQQMVAGSQGAILGYEILSQQEVSQVDEETSARVRASDAGWSYTGSASASASGEASASASALDGSASASGSERYSASYQEQGTVDAKRGASSFDSAVTHRSMRSYWKVRVRAQIAQYRAADTQGKPTIVVALPRTKSDSYAVGDGRVDAAEVAQTIRARLSDTLTQTQRFIVLDREFGDELQAEIEHINSGNVRLQDTARVGQQLASDLILIPTVERFEYPRSVRTLRMSGRQVSSYSGGGRITLRLINATTGQVVLSDSFDHQLASTGPSTLPRNINGRGMATAMMESLSAQIGAAIVTELFPVSVVSVNGDQVVLSQGGDTVQAGQRWQAVRLGEELKDPQTGRSLGRSEYPCCTIRIDRVAAQTSYGTLEDGAETLRAGFQPGQIELRQQLADKPATTVAGTSSAAAAVSKAKPKPKPKSTAAVPAEDPNW